MIILDNLITGKTDFARQSNDENIEFITHDIIKPFQYNGKLDFVIHAAGIASPSTTIGYFLWKNWTLRSLAHETC